MRAQRLGAGIAVSSGFDSHGRLCRLFSRTDFSYLDIGPIGGVSWIGLMQCGFCLRWLTPGACRRQSEAERAVAERQPQGWSRAAANREMVAPIVLEVEKKVAARCQTRRPDAGVGGGDSENVPHSAPILHRNSRIHRSLWEIEVGRRVGNVLSDNPVSPLLEMPGHSLSPKADGKPQQPQVNRKRAQKGLDRLHLQRQPAVRPDQARRTPAKQRSGR